jgi:hypothetical protein
MIAVEKQERLLRVVVIFESIIVPEMTFLVYSYKVEGKVLCEGGVESSITN